uniref:Uncharacterized protein n=1 Tax=Candidatus Kentrum sp. TC TaxID=2126339 RepID=A0A450Y7D0_9GAMM|nr:MAG: hypothetical protein BECKTC1821D_GA0114238_100160 [Candidatus Kentron sp. TC]
MTIQDVAVIIYSNALLNQNYATSSELPSMRSISVVVAVI